MLFEIITTTIMGGVAAKAFIAKQNLTDNDSGKIQRIISLSGLNVKDGKDTLTTQLVRKQKYEWGWEYKYRIPYGRSFEDYAAKQKHIEDGLNNRRQQVDLKIDKNFFKNVLQLNKTKLTNQKEIEMSFDGLLCIRVYDSPLPSTVDYIPGHEWKVPVGQTRDQNAFKFHDFEKIPHLVLGGATRYGKSNFINSMITSLVHSEPEHTHLYLIDLKGGVELSDYERIKQTESIAYEPEEALATLKTVYDRMRELQEEVRRKGKKNVQQAGIKDRYFVIVDEVGELNPAEAITREEKAIKIECQRYMSQIARLGAGLGFRQILATQYPTGDVIPRQCKQNSDAKLSFRVQSAVASRVVLDNEGAECLPQITGRAIYQTADKREIVQTPYITNQIIKETIEPHIRLHELKKEEVNNVNPTPQQPPRANTVTFEKA
ncbi:FtsK/SpoIIIE domain-containing protein [Rummeliibacillus stabekisii]|uniref:FtsK/SpoIIIE domain-containing protein n=1 Tax=Rummeliibacillus stabekisii TaxID=241244 RepID=UPI0037191F6C